MEPFSNDGGNAIRSDKHVGIDSLAVFENRRRAFETGTLRSGSYNIGRKFFKQDSLQRRAMDADRRRARLPAEVREIVHRKDTSIRGSRGSPLDHGCRGKDLVFNTKLAQR